MVPTTSFTGLIVNLRQKASTACDSRFNGIPGLKSCQVDPVGMQGYQSESPFVTPIPTRCPVLECKHSYVVDNRLTRVEAQDTPAASCSLPTALPHVHTCTGCDRLPVMVYEHAAALPCIHNVPLVRSKCAHDQQPRTGAVIFLLQLYIHTALSDSVQQELLYNT